MTTPSTARKAGPFTGNGSQSSWPFSFKVFAEGDIKVTAADASGTETVLTLTTDYTVSLNANQETSPGGSVTYALASGYKLTITGALDYDQPLDLPAGGNFDPTALETQLDRMVMQTQQLSEEMVRAVKVPVTDDGTGELSGALAQGILALGPIADDIETVAGIDTEVQIVANNVAAVAIVGAAIGDVDTVANNVAAVTTVAGISGNVTTVAQNSANVTTVAGISADVTAVADIEVDVTTVANSAGHIATAATNVVDITNFADVYLGPSATEPAARADTGPLQPGDLYFDTSRDTMRTYTGAAWVDVGVATPVTITVDSFNGNGSTTDFTLSVAPAFEAACDVYVSGVHQAVDTDYNISGTTLAFTSAPPSGTGNIEVRILSAHVAGTPANGSVTTVKLADGSVTTAKLADLDYGSIV